MVRWWWPGDDVTDAELRREIDLLDSAGFGGAEIQAFFKGLDAAALSDAQKKRINGFATNSFFSHVKTAVEEASNRGLFIDYTFGSGWPFGGGEAITPELAAIELRWSHLAVAGPAPFHSRLQIPSIMDGDPSRSSEIFLGLPDGWAERMRTRTKIVAAVAIRGTGAQWDFFQSAPRGRGVLRPGQLDHGTSVDLSTMMQSDGTLHWDVPPGTWHIFVFASVPTGQRINGAAGAGPQLVLDHLNVDAFRAHAQRVGDRALPFLNEYCGNGLRAIFCDSLEVRANLFWSDDFLAEFQRRRGYNLVPYLPVLQVQTFDEPFGEFIDTPVFEFEDVGAQVRHDYRQTVSDLISERFYGEFNNWAHTHQLLARTQAHGAPADVSRIYGEADIAETEQLYDMGGYDFRKLASSAAHVAGHPIVGSESFVWPGALYQTTPEKVKRGGDQLVTSGVNAIVFHGFAYRLPNTAEPGWHPFSGINGSGNYSSQFNDLNPLWPSFAKLNTYITRLQYISQVGVNVAAVALYRNDVEHGAEELPPPPKLNQAVLDAGYGYDHINARSLLECSVSNRILVSPGGATYQALIVPSSASIDAAVVEKISEFAAVGLTIFFAGPTPARSAGLSSRSFDMRSAIRNLRSHASVHFCSDTTIFLQQLQSMVAPDIRFRTEAVPFFHKRIGGTNAFFLYNDTDAARRIDADFEAEGTPELWNPWTGDTSVLSNYQRNQGRVSVELDLEPFASALLVFSQDNPPAEPNQTAAKLAKLHSSAIGTGGWKLITSGRMPSGEETVIRKTLATLIDWSLDEELRGFSGRGTYTTTFSLTEQDTKHRLVLDLGIVREVAEITLNGTPVTTLLLRPYQVDVTGAVRLGENLLEIGVTNTLFNYMVLRKPSPFRPGPTENPSGLMSGGLIGPVQLKWMS